MFKIDYVTDENKMHPNFKVVKRLAIKGVVIKEGKVLLIHTNRGDYKFPGGGVKKGEKMEEALKREIAEETGFSLKSMGDVIGEVLERKPDQYEVETVFEMKSIYVTCDLNYADLKEQNLDLYEAEQEFKPLFITLESALKNNRELLNFNLKDMNPWVLRETDVMAKLIEMGM